MDQSTHFNLNLVTGADKVNPLTIDRPNYETIDEQMYKNQIAAISEATELKSGTVHAITCLTEGAVFFRFTATSDYAAGDTFTYNGSPVTAVLPDGSGLQAGVFKINGTVLCSILGTLLTVYSITASGIASDSEKLGGQLPVYYAKATDAISTYVHSRIGTVNNFVGTGANGKVKIVANIQAGDSIQINGQPVTAFAGADDFVSTVTGQDLVGKTLFFLWDSTSNIVNFKLGGGGRVTVDGLTADVVWNGNTIELRQGAEVLQTVIGRLDVLAVFGVQGDNGGTTGQGGIVRTGDGYSVVSSAPTIPGVPLIAIAGKSSEYGTFNVGGNDVGVGAMVYTEFPNKNISFRHNGGAFKYCSASCVVLGY